jgi:hypothetical protein
VLPPGVEDPVSALFDLSDRTAEMAPTMRRMYRYTSTVVVVYLVIMVILLLVSLRSDLLLALLALVAIAFGVVALSLLRETDRFFRSFAQRHRAIRLFRDADPAPRIPEGRTPVERLVRYLRQSNPRIEELLRDDPNALKLRVELPGGERPAAFDLLLVHPGGASYRAIGIGSGGFAILGRIGPDDPTVADLQAFARDVTNVAPHLDGLAVRSILLRANPKPLSDAVYDFAVGHPIPVAHGFTQGRSSLEIISENPNGTYDSVPYVLGVP